MFGEVEEPANTLNTTIDAQAIKKSIIIELNQYKVCDPQETVYTNLFTCWRENALQLPLLSKYAAR